MNHQENLNKQILPIFSKIQIKKTIIIKEVVNKV